MILSKAIRPDHCTCEFTKAKQHHTTFVLQPLYFVISPAYRRACYRNEHAASKYIVIAYRLQTPGRNIPMAETRRHSCCTKEENNKKRTTFRCMNSQLVWRETKWTEWIKDCNSEKNRRYNRTSFIFTGQQKRSLFSSEDRARWNGDPACCGKRRDTAREFLNLKKFRIRIQKFWYRSGVGNCNSGPPLRPMQSQCWVLSSGRRTLCVHSSRMQGSETGGCCSMEPIVWNRKATGDLKIAQA